MGHAVFRAVLLGRHRKVIPAGRKADPESVLDEAERFWLAATPDTAGYGLELESIGTADAGGWWHANDGTDYYADGRYYWEDGHTEFVYRDMGLAITSVPEPTVLTLTALGLFVLFARGRRRRVR